MFPEFSAYFPLKRKSTATTYVNGRAVTGATETSSILANIQPLRGQEMLLLPEARRTSQAIRIYTNTLLRVANSVAGYDADIVTYAGQDFEILSCEPWQSGVISHYKAVGVKK